MELWPIWVPSKGRPYNARFLKLARDQGVQVTVVTEPYEAEGYLSAFPFHTIIPLPEADKGLAYSREYIKNDPLRGTKWFWMIDDDVTSFYRVMPDARVEPIKIAEALIEAQQQIRQVPQCALASLEYQQFAWASKGRITVNSYCDVVVAMNVSRCRHIHYRPIPVKEDRDFALQVLQAKYFTARISSVCFATPKRGSNQGGLYDEYQSGKEKEGAEELARLWPGIAEVFQKKDGHWDAKINWKKTNSLPDSFQGVTVSVQK